MYRLFDILKLNISQRYMYMYVHIYINLHHLFMFKIGRYHLHFQFSKVNKISNFYFDL